MTHKRPPRLGELSMEPKAIKQRTRVLLDDQYDERQAASKRASTGRKRLKEMSSGITVCNKNPYWASRVRHHLSKGRDAADIVVRENIPASIVTKLIEEIHDAK